MDDKRIIYERPDGSIGVITPLSASGLTIEDIARKDVPAGAPYLIIDATELPEDRTYRDAWTADFSEPDGVGIGHEAWFEEQSNANHQS